MKRRRISRTCSRTNTWTCSHRPPRNRGRKTGASLSVRRGKPVSHDRKMKAQAQCKILCRFGGRPLWRRDRIIAVTKGSVHVSQNLFTAGWGGILGLGAAGGPAKADSVLRVGKAFAGVFDFTPVDVGVAQGFFKKRGLEIKEFNFAGSAKLQQALAAD